MESSEFYTETEASDRPDDDIDNQKPIKVKKLRHRKRKRNFYNTIRSQMEFYFGDANLSKDRFLMNLIKIDPYVPLETFLTFNKMKTLVNNTEQLAKALSTSKLLELNEDKTKVRRVTELPVNRDADDKTLYVESLPPKADHDWVKNVFSRFGPIAYVSLPRFKISKKLKEFGFVEFESEKSVEKALKAFEQLNGILHYDTEPEKLLSVTTFIKEQKEIELSTLKTEDLNTEDEQKKRPLSPDSASDPMPIVKRQKIIEQITESEEVTSTTDVQTTDNEGGETKKKKRRRRRKKKSHKKVIATGPDVAALKILPKIEWKRLRNKYLNMRRKSVSIIKREVKKKLNNSAQISNKRMKLSVEKPHSMNFYCATQEEDVKNHGKDDSLQKEKDPFLDRIPSFKYEPNVIIHMKFTEPCIDVKDFKSDIKQFPGVKYVDVKEGALEAFIRCDTSKSAKTLRRRISCTGCTSQLLSGEKEIEYWNKMLNDRESKLRKQVQVKQKRGREKIPKVLAKHTRFEDDD